MANASTADAVITIEAEKTEWLLHPLAGHESCCIFRVPECLAEIQPKTYGPYQPHLVSIGPYHYGKPHLKMMQQHKQRYLRELLARTESTGPKLDDYLQAVLYKQEDLRDGYSENIIRSDPAATMVRDMEQDIRDCYSENIKFSRSDLAAIMVLDGLFIIELFCREAGLVVVPESHGDDPIFNLAWMMPNLIRDLLRLENQIPFFILQILFDKSKASRMKDDLSFEKVAFAVISRAVEVVNQQFTDEPKHLLDLVRLSFIPPQVHDELSGHYKPSVQLFKSARKLYLSGIKFKSVPATSLLDVKFHKGVLEIPKLILDDVSTDLFLNFVAFEQHRYWHCSLRPITSYAVFMSCLIRTTEDATYLRDIDIIENYLGSDEAVDEFIKTFVKEVNFVIHHSYHCKLFQDMDDYLRNIWRLRWAWFKFTYFKTAVILLLLTVLQSFYAVLAYHRPK